VRKARGIRVGVDFDNTIVCYDALFHRCARERGLIPEGVPPTKQAIREYLWNLPGGNTPWTELQSEVYGRRILEADPFPGVRECFARCWAADMRVSVISHKDRFPALGEKTDLRAAARMWLEAKGFARLLAESAVFFEDSREAKILRIQAERCDGFVDDLAELFGDPAFPQGVRKMLFAPSGNPPAGGGTADMAVCRDWDAIWEHIARLRDERLAGTGTDPRR